MRIKMRRAGDGMRPADRMKYPPANLFAVRIPEFVTRTGFIIPAITIKNPYAYYWSLQRVHTGWVLCQQLRLELKGRQGADHDANALEAALKATYGGDGTLRCSLQRYWCAVHDTDYTYGTPMNEDRVRAAWIEYALGAIWEAFGAPRWREVNTSNRAALIGGGLYRRRKVGRVSNLVKRGLRAIAVHLGQDDFGTALFATPEGLDFADRNSYFLV